ncbi:hypothetical protein BJX66DRAFT_341650 [Aspergillus keveii]|uniref:Glycine zipper 2TM domain-containing protein n=1 Tax=Aspergillus keveii TaxID=714993 RepID=A0ABR4FUK8_9EURO
MSNRDYYGDNVPAGLGQNTSTDPAMNYTTQSNQYRSGDYDPNLNTDTLPEGEGERGLGSTVVGGAGGAFIGHKVGKKSDHGTLGAIGGAVAGAIVANVASNMIKGDSGHGQGHGRGGHGIVGSLRNRRIDRLESRLDRRR